MALRLGHGLDSSWEQLSEPLDPERPPSWLPRPPSSNRQWAAKMEPLLKADSCAAEVPPSHCAVLLSSALQTRQMLLTRFLEFVSLVDRHDAAVQEALDREALYSGGARVCEEPPEVTRTPPEPPLKACGWSAAGHSLQSSTV